MIPMEANLEQLKIITLRKDRSGKCVQSHEVIVVKNWRMLRLNLYLILSEGVRMLKNPVFPTNGTNIYLSFIKTSASIMQIQLFF